MGYKHELVAGLALVALVLLFALLGVWWEHCWEKRGDDHPRARLTKAGGGLAEGIAAPRPRDSGWWLGFLMRVLWEVLQALIWLILM